MQPNPLINKDMENNKNYTNVSFEDEGFVNECLEAFDKNVEQMEFINQWRTDSDSTRCSL